MFGWEIGRWVVVGAAAAIVGAFVFGVVEYRRLASRLKRLEEGKSPRVAAPASPPPRQVYPPRAVVPEQPVVISLNTCADGAAPSDLLSYGLNATCYTPVIDRRESRAHMVVVVSRIRNNSPRGILLRRLHLSLELSPGARKLEPAAPLVLLSRLSFFDAAADQRALDRIRDVFLERLFGDRSFNRSVLLVKPRETIVTYAAFLPRYLTDFPVFEEDILRFGVALTVGDNPTVFNDFHARRAPNLSAVLA